MIRAAVATLLALGAGADQYPVGSPDDKRPAVVIGRVVDAATGRTVRSAIVRLEGSGGHLTHLTDARGRFFFLGLPAGDYEITARRDGYFDGAFGRVRAGGEQLPLPLAAGEWRADVEIPMFRPATIAGVVRDEAGEPVTGVMVEALRREFTEAGESWRPVTLRQVTDDRGEYRLSDLPPGDYVVRVPSVQATMPLDSLDAIGQTGRTSRGALAVMFLNGGPGLVSTRASLSSMTLLADDRTVLISGATAPPPPAEGGVRFAYPSTFHPSADSVEGAVPIALATGETRLGVDVVLMPAPSVQISGRLEGPDGPVAGLFLQLVRPDAPDGAIPVAATIAAPNGTFTFADVPAGAYDLRARTPSADLTRSTVVPASGPGRTPFTAALQGSEQLFGDLPLVVFDRDIEDVVVSLSPGGGITGTVVFESDVELPAGFRAPDLHVVLRRTSGTAADIPPVRVETDWTFTFAGVRPGAYVVEAGGLPEGWFVAAVTRFGRDIAEQPIDVSTGAETADVEVRLTQEPSGIRGTVFDSMGRLQPGARVVAVPAAGRLPGLDPDARPHAIRSVRANAHGVFMIHGLRPGAWHLVALDDRQDVPWRNARALTAAAGNAVVPVTVEPGRTTEASLMKR